MVLRSLYLKSQLLTKKLQERESQVIELQKKSPYYQILIKKPVVTL